METTFTVRRTDRRKLDVTIVLFGIAVILVLLDGVTRFWHQVTERIVPIDITAGAGAISSQAPSGSNLIVAGETQLNVATSEVGMAAISWLRSAQLLETLCLVFVLITAALFIRRIATGRLFDMAFNRRLNLMLASVVIWMVLPSVAQNLGARIAMQELGLEAQDGWGLSPAHFWLFALAIVVLGAVKLAFHSAGQLARDQQGTI